LRQLIKAEKMSVDHELTGNANAKYLLMFVKKFIFCLINSLIDFELEQNALEDEKALEAELLNESIFTKKFMLQISVISISIIYFFVFRISKRESFENKRIEFCAMLSIILATVIFFKQFKFSSSLEFIFISVMYMHNGKVTFPICQTVKMFTSLIVFFFEILLLRRKNSQLTTLQYLIWLKKTPCHNCHAAIRVGENVYHYTNNGALVDIVNNVTVEQKKVREFKPMVAPYNFSTIQLL
jgi:hypothetical protein